MASRVIVVDDDAAVRKALDRLLRMAGYATELCASAEEFLARGPAEPPACALLDVRMDGMNGIDLQRAIRGTPRDLPVVVITGHGNESEREQALALGAVEVLDKPLDHVVLLAAIERALALSLRG